MAVVRQSAAVPARLTGPAATQQLCYLIEPRERMDVVHRCDIRVSLWVAHLRTDAASILPESACEFVPRSSRGVAAVADFPRYVDGQDKSCLGVLLGKDTEGPWMLEGGADVDTLRKVIATGRAFWKSLRGRPLRLGGERTVAFVAGARVDGGCDGADDGPAQADGGARVTVAMTPPWYFDAARAEVGPVRPVFPPVVSQPLASLTPRLFLSEHEEILCYFVYNGAPVDRRRLAPGQSVVRLAAGDSVAEVLRDPDRERVFESQLADALGGVTLDDRASWLHFMMTGVPLLKSAGWDIVVDERFPYRVVPGDQWYGDLGTDRRGAAWFNLRLGVMVDGVAINLLPALTRYLQSTLNESDTRTSEADTAGCRVGDHWMVRLDDGRYLPIGMDRIQRIAHTLVELFDRDSLDASAALTLPRSQSRRLTHLCAELRTLDHSLGTLIDELKGFTGIQARSPPAAFSGELRTYQQEGLGWLQFLRRYRLGGVLADDMGLGKTVQTIAHLTVEWAEGRLTKPVLIVAPVSALGNWMNEVVRFAPSLSVFVWHGAPRRRSVSQLNSAQVIITAYPLLLIDGELLLNREYGLVILDEAQNIKNPGAKVTQAARALRADYRLCLSGTPVENHLGELWSLFEFLQPGLLGDERHFQRHYRTPIEKNGNRERAQGLSARIAPFLLRRTKDSVARELPPKVEIVEPVTFDEKQRDFYDGVRLAMHQRIREVVQNQGLARSQITILDALLRLRQVCCDPRLVESATGIASAKLEWLCTVLPELVAEGRRILLFSQFTSMLKLIEAAVTEIEIPYCVLTGETRDRTSVVERFQGGGVPLFLISLKAGGTALNLTAADTVIHYDPWWNPAVEAQATDRAHRIGQTRSVFVYKLIAQDTVEERMLQLQAEKRVLADGLYTEKSASPTALGVEDLEMLFAP